MAENVVVQSIMSENVVVKSTTAEKRKRGQNFTAEDKDLLVKLLVNYKDIILNKKTDSATNEAKQKAWSDVTNAFNSIATVHRTKDSLLKLWENMKQRVECYQTKGTTVCPIDTMEQVRELLGRASTGAKEELTQDSDATSYNGESSEVCEMIIPQISFSAQEDGAALEISNDEQLPKIPKLEIPEQSPSWSGPEKWARPDLHEIMRNNKQKASSFVDLMMGRCTLDDVMQEFKMNGTDSPYTPDDDGAWPPQPRRQDDLAGFGPSGAYLRQKSWPEPERTPVTRLPPPQAPRSNWLEDEAAHARIGELWFGPSGANLQQKSWPEPERTPSQALRSNWLEDEAAHAQIAVPDTSTPIPAHEGLTADQMRVLFSLPDSVLYPLLRDMEQNRALSERKKKHPQECRFCKNNGERESYYRSHTLKDAAGRVRCPVLRAFVCRRCGATGDHAHTIKYCPLSTDEERYKSAAMMRSVRQASGRRRASPPEYPELVMFGEAPPSLRDNARSYARTAPLDPRWAALEQKLML